MFAGAAARFGSSGPVAGSVLEPRSRIRGGLNSPRQRSVEGTSIQIRVAFRDVLAHCVSAQPRNGIVGTSVDVAVEGCVILDVVCDPAPHERGCMLAHGL